MSSISVIMSILLLVFYRNLGVGLEEERNDQPYRESRKATDEVLAAGFIGAAAAPLLLVILSVKDPLVIAFGAPIIGSGAFFISFYLRNRRDD